MLPRGAIWQRLRAQALDAIPAGTRVPFSSQSGLESWLTAGANSVLSHKPNRVVLGSVPVEVGGALYCDAGLHLDHAIEHAIHVRHQLSAGQWYSAAWLVVTFYYWAFFLALVLTRLTGSTSVFITRDLASALSKLAGGKIAAGTMVLECGKGTSSVHREMILRRGGRTRVHDAVWQQCFETLRSVVQSVTVADRSPAEERLYEAIGRSVRTLGDAWPSDLRNAVNYSPGLAYGAVRRTTKSDAFNLIRLDPPSAFPDVLGRLETNVAGLVGSQGVEGQSVLVTRALVDLTFVLHAVVSELNDDVVERRDLDKRWPRARLAFCQAQAVGYTTADWPCQSS